MTMVPSDPQRPGPQPASSAPTADPFEARRRHAFRVGMGVGAAIALAVVLLIVQNGESAQIDWIFFHFRTRLWLVLALTLIAGAVTWELIRAWVFRSGRHIRARRTARKPPP